MSDRRRRLAVIGLAVTGLLWLLALLFLFNVVNIFDRFLMKVPGPVVVLGWMGLAPAFAIWLGWRARRRGRADRTHNRLLAIGGVFMLAFLVVIAFPMVRDIVEPDTPRNPTVPRAVGDCEGLPVFPGAEGFGTHTVAGRGGAVLEVTTLADSGPGSLRAALEHPAPRTIVFRVAGTIELDKALFVTEPYLTVAGHTAPGGGITIKNAGLQIFTHDVLVQHLRIRPGNEGDVNADNNDAVELLGDRGGSEGAYNVVVDHVSAGWSEDETITTWFGAHDITISWSIVSEALNRSRHRKETHSAGLLVGDGSYHVTMHHNLLAHNDFRNPLISGGGTHEFAHNLIYNWGVLAGEIGDDDSNSFLNFIGNTYVPGPSSELGNHEFVISPSRGVPQLYLNENTGPHRSGEQDDWSMVSLGYGAPEPAPEAYRASEPFSTCYAGTSSSSGELLQLVGATAPRRDPVDTRVVSEVENRTGRIIDSPEEVGGYPTLEAGSPTVDQDHDGMPDLWEVGAGLDPDDPLDGMLDADGDGYTNLEEYLHSLLP